MIEYTKADYLAACEALWDKKPTEWMCNGVLIPWEYCYVPADAELIQWRVADPTREYREAFAAGKRVEWRYDKSWSEWQRVDAYHVFDSGIMYQIVEPETVKLYPFTALAEGETYPSGLFFYPSIEEARANEDGKIYPIDADGSIEVES